jgi:gluconolactonase
VDREPICRTPKIALKLRVTLMRQLRHLHFLSNIVLLVSTGVARADDTPAVSSLPKGEVRKYTFDHSKIFPGTVREYSVYVPKQ